jgi:hypothetical protein
MRILLALALLAALTATTAAAGTCGREKSRACKPPSATVDLNYAPDLSSKALAADPAAQDARKSKFLPSDPVPYNGPAFGVPPIGRGATIGYHWSTD